MDRLTWWEMEKCVQYLAISSLCSTHGTKLNKHLLLNVIILIHSCFLLKQLYISYYLQPQYGSSNLARTYHSYLHLAPATRANQVY